MTSRETLPILMEVLVKMALEQRPLRASMFAANLKDVHPGVRSHARSRSISGYETPSAERQIVLPLLGNDVVNTFLQKLINMQQDRNCYKRFFSAQSAPSLYSNDQHEKLVETQWPGVHLGHPVPGDINKGTWPSRWGEVSGLTVKYGYGSCATRTTERFDCKLHIRPLVKVGPLHGKK
jgi:hypothetical protein